MPTRGRTPPDHVVHRTAGTPIGPWQDFDDVMDRLLGLFGTPRPAGRTGGSRDAGDTEEGSHRS